MNKTTKHHAHPGNRTGVDKRIAPDRGRDSALPIREPAPGDRVQPRPQDEHRSTSRR